MDLRGWVNDGLITVFFLTVGLELSESSSSANSVTSALRHCRVAPRPAEEWWDPHWSMSLSRQGVGRCMGGGFPWRRTSLALRSALAPW